jgi:raffinose/stachyose/melibiose transport system permease protein
MYPLYEKRARNLIPYLILMPALLLFIIFQLLPSVATVAFSFTDITRTGYKAVQFVGLDNYREFFRPATFRDKGIAMKNSIVFTVVVVVLQNALGLLVALILNRKWKGRSFFRASIFLPIILGITVNALIWRLMFNPFDGPVQLILKSVFNTESLFFGSPGLAFPLIIFVQIWSYMGYSAVIFLAGLQAIPESLYEAAGIDGAGAWRKFLNVTFPLIAQAVTVNVLLAIIGALRTFDTIYVTTNGQFDTQTMAFYMFDQAFSMSGGAGGGRLGFASAVATILFLFILIVATVAQWYLRRREIEL